MNNPFSPSPYINGDGSHFSGGFTNTTLPTSSHTLESAKNNVQAANASKWQGGGGGRGGRKRKNTRSLYRPLMTTRRHRHTRTCGCRGRTRARRSQTRQRRRRTMRGGGGYHQWEPANLSNVYSVGGNLSAGHSALANPPLFHQNAGTPQCSSTYNHFTDAASVHK
jgi:hypothetical protein